MTLDAVDLLTAQHEEIAGLLDDILAAHPNERPALFGRLTRLLVAHETAEEQVLRPVTRFAVPGGESIADLRTDEEREIKQLLGILEEIGPGSEVAGPLFFRLARAMLEHAENEELTEFPDIRRSLGHRQLVALAPLVRAVEAIAPTHPHPGVETALANAVLSPALSVVDRVRDRVRA